MSVRTRIVHVQEVQVGEGSAMAAPGPRDAPSRIAVLPVGYDDGVDWRLGNVGEVLVRGRPLFPSLGRISMDYTTVDVPEVPSVGLAQPRHAPRCGRRRAHPRGRDRGAHRHRSVRSDLLHRKRVEAVFNRRAAVPVETPPVPCSRARSPARNASGALALALFNALRELDMVRDAGLLRRLLWIAAWTCLAILAALWLVERSGYLTRELHARLAAELGLPEDRLTIERTSLALVRAPASTSRA
jgi:hypothetical protein